MPRRASTWYTDDLPLLDDRCGLPLDRPFTTRQARALGLSRRTHDRLVERGLLRPVVHGVYVAAQVRETLELRVQALRLVVPESATVTDYTAAWLHGVDVLPRWGVHEAPPVQVFDRAGSRLRRPGVASGTRTLTDGDVMTIGGIHVTTPLRTALDLGRLLPRYDAIGALDAFVGFGVSRDALLQEVERFRGDRGVVQLRGLAPLADGRAESPPESRLRLIWIDIGLPTPEPQWWVHDDGVQRFRIDLALPECLFGAEYQGERFHTGDEAEQRDADRSLWLQEQEGWTLVFFWKDDLYGPDSHPEAMLVYGLREARRRMGAWRPQGRFL